MDRQMDRGATVVGLPGSSGPSIRDRLRGDVFEETQSTWQRREPLLRLIEAERGSQ